MIFVYLRWTAEHRYLHNTIMPPSSVFMPIIHGISDFRSSNFLGSSTKKAPGTFSFSMTGPQGKAGSSPAVFYNIITALIRFDNIFFSTMCLENSSTINNLQKIFHYKGLILQLEYFSSNLKGPLSFPLHLHCNQPWRRVSTRSI